MRLLPKFAYPKPRRSSLEEVLHEVKVPDPYRWMEDPTDQATQQFVEQQNAVSKRFLEDCAHRQELEKTLQAVSNYEKFERLQKSGDYYYYSYNSGLDNHNIIRRKKHLNDDENETFLDPNEFSDDGAVSLAKIVPSKNGTYFAYVVSEQGSDWKTVHVRKAADKQDLPDRLTRVRFSNPSWTHDERGFFYGQYPESAEGGKVYDGKVVDPSLAKNQKIYYHLLGTEQSEDVLAAEFPEHPTWTSRTKISDCGRKLIVTSNPDLLTDVVSVADIPPSIKEPLKLQVVANNAGADLNYIGNDGDIFYWRTNFQRPNHAVVKFDIKEPANWTEVIAEDPQRPMRSAYAAGGDKLIVVYYNDVADEVEIFDKQGGRHLQKLPFEKGSVSVTFAEWDQSEAIFEFRSLTVPTAIYRCNLDEVPSSSLSSSSAAPLVEYRRTRWGPWSTDDVAYKQVFYRSADGTRVPMYILHRADLTLDSSAPALLNVYGGFGISKRPDFSIFNLMLVYTLGFVVSIANVRGGDEYGLRWHDAGRRAHKQNTIDDVHAAARYLVDGNYTSASRLALYGTSNGGLVTLAGINQRPELFGAAVAAVPVTDLLRFHKFTIGHLWRGEYGDPDNASDFAFIRRLSPLHNIPRCLTNYPAVLVETADHDDRVVPSHSLKFIAELQYRSEQMQNRRDRLNCTADVVGEAGERSGGDAGSPFGVPTTQSNGRSEQCGNCTDDSSPRPLLAIIDTGTGHGGGKPTYKRRAEMVNRMCFLTKVFDLTYDGRKFGAVTAVSGAAGA